MIQSRLLYTIMSAREKVFRSFYRINNPDEMMEHFIKEQKKEDNKHDNLEILSIDLILRLIIERNGDVRITLAKGTFSFACVRVCRNSSLHLT